jgi:hypothetical protein
VPAYGARKAKGSVGTALYYESAGRLSFEEQQALAWLAWSISDKLTVNTPDKVQLRLGTFTRLFQGPYSLAGRVN